MSPEPRTCRVDGKPCHNEPVPDHQQECRFWWNYQVTETCIAEAHGRRSRTVQPLVGHSESGAE